MPRCRRLNGEPLTEKSLYKLHWTTSYRITGKKTNPHLVRDSIVTYLRWVGRPRRRPAATIILFTLHDASLRALGSSQIN